MGTLWMECWVGHSLTSLSPITREFSHLMVTCTKRTWGVEELIPHTGPTAHSQDYSLSPRTEETIILAVSSSSDEKFVSFIFCLLFFFKWKESFASPLNLLLIWKWTLPALGCQATPANSPVSEATIWLVHPVERVIVKDHGPVPSLDVKVSKLKFERKKLIFFGRTYKSFL